MVDSASQESVDKVDSVVSEAGTVSSVSSVPDSTEASAQTLVFQTNLQLTIQALPTDLEKAQKHG